MTFFSILTKLDFSGQIFVEVPNINFNENMLSGSWVVNAGGWTLWS